jgi:hypothetical protein
MPFFPLFEAHKHLLFISPIVVGWAATAAHSIAILIDNYSISPARSYGISLVSGHIGKIVGYSVFSRYSDLDYQLLLTMLARFNFLILTLNKRKIIFLIVKEES